MRPWSRCTSWLADAQRMLAHLRSSWSWTVVIDPGTSSANVLPPCPGLSQFIWFAFFPSSTRRKFALFRVGYFHHYLMTLSRQLAPGVRFLLHPLPPGE